MGFKHSNCIIVLNKEKGLNRVKLPDNSADIRPDAAARKIITPRTSTIFAVPSSLLHFRHLHNTLLPQNTCTQDREQNHNDQKIACNAALKVFLYFQTVSKHAPPASAEPYMRRLHFRNAEPHRRISPSDGAVRKGSPPPNCRR